MNIPSLMGEQDGKDFLKDAEEKEYRVPVSRRVSLKYTPTADYSIVTLNECQILSNGNILTLIAPPGTGKSNIAEAISSSLINGDCDSFGFKVNLPEGKEILLCDTEGTMNDCFRGFNRIIKRCSIDPAELKDGEIDRLHFLSFISSESLDESRKDIQEILETGKIGLMILDGVGDFISTVNDEEKSKEIVRWLITLANKYDMGVMVTIHPNPKDQSYKPTGHLGSYLLKKAESVMVVCKADNNTRLITTNFEHGKVRNAPDVLETAIEWSDAHKMFMTADVAQARHKNETGKKLNDFFTELFTLKKSYTYGDLLDAVKLKAKCKDTAANNKIFKATELNIIKVHMNIYTLNELDEDDSVPF